MQVLLPTSFTRRLPNTLSSKTYVDINTAWVLNATGPPSQDQPNTFTLGERGTSRGTPLQGSRLTWDNDGPFEGQEGGWLRGSLLNGVCSTLTRIMQYKSSNMPIYLDV